MSEIVAETPAGANQGRAVLQRDGTDPVTGNPVYRQVWIREPEDRSKLPPNHPDSLSSTMVRLFIRPVSAQRFEATFDKACAAAGITDPGFGHTVKNPGFLRPFGALASCCDDTKHGVIWFKPNSRNQLDDFREVMAAVDPAVCPIPRYDIGYIFKTSLSKLLLELGDAHVFDGLGNRLDDEALEALSSHLRAVLAARVKQEKQRRTVDMGGGVFRVQGDLSFQHEVETRGPRGGRKASRRVDFEAPALAWGPGRALGTKMAREHLTWLQMHRVNDARLEETLGAAFAALAEGKPFSDQPSRATVAAGYLGMMTQALRATAEFVNPKWMDFCVEQAERGITEAEKTREALRRRVRALNAAKKAAPEGGAA